MHFQLQSPLDLTRLLLTLCFFFNDPATTEIYTLSLHDALPISGGHRAADALDLAAGRDSRRRFSICRDRKSTRLNSSHLVISYAVFCLIKITAETDDGIIMGVRHRRHKLEGVQLHP